MYRTHTCGELGVAQAGQEVMLSGWVHRRRDLGGLIFVDLRDRYGLTQVVFHPEKTQNYSIAESLRYEYVVKVTGLVVRRDEATINSEIATGAIELQVTSVEVLSTAKPMPFEIFETDKGTEDEELRLKHRFLELRRERLKNNMIFRAKMLSHIRGFMESRNFLEVHTPILTVSSPEGARDFLVPSRIHPGKFYALPQAPQQYKQLLMVAGFDRYYQIAPCLRDEDPRSDRSPGEFYQLDTETSFLTPDEFFDLMEPLFIELTEKLTTKQVWKKPFPRIPFREAMEKYGSDRPDLRFDLPIQNITDWAKGTGFKVFAEAISTRVLVVPGGENFSRKEIDDEFTDAAKRAHGKGLAWLKFVDGKLDGTIAKFFSEAELQTLINTLQLKDNAILFFAADTVEISCKALGAVRDMCGTKLNLKDPNVIAWAWIVDFPFYEWNPDKAPAAGKPQETGPNGETTGSWDFVHNPFSMPRGGLEALNTQNPGDVIANQYDIIANGLELSSGSQRNKDADVMYRAFEIVGYGKEVVDKKFGHMIKAFEFGAPPHCGFAPGIERMVMLLTGEPNIRAVMAFPKNQKAEEPMVGSPAEATPEQLKELSIRVDVK